MTHAVFTVLINKARTVAKRAARTADRPGWRPARERSERPCGPATPARVAETVAGIAVLAVTLAGCGGGGHQAARTPPSTAPSTTAPSTRGAPATTSTSLNPQGAAVLSAYRAEQAAFVQAEHTANAFSPALGATMTGAQLQSARRFLVADKAAGIVGRGNIAFHPRLASIQRNQAVVYDCAFDSSELVYAKTGKPVPPITPPEKVGIRAVLTKVSPGVWKVAQQHVTEGSCPPGY